MLDIRRRNFEELGNMSLIDLHEHTCNLFKVSEAVFELSRAGFISFETWNDISSEIHDYQKTVDIFIESKSLNY